MVVPLSSLRISRVRTYFGYCQLRFFSPTRLSLPTVGLPMPFGSFRSCFLQSITSAVFLLRISPPPLSLAATRGISFDFFSSAYLDVSVQRVPLVNLYLRFQLTIHSCELWGFPHSEIPGSMPVCGSPRLIAACHVLRRLLLPRHSPCALLYLTFEFMLESFLLVNCLLPQS